MGNSPLAHLVAGLALSSPAASVRAEACKVMQALCSCLPPAPQHRLAESSSAGSIPTQVSPAGKLPLPAPGESLGSSALLCGWYLEEQCRCCTLQSTQRP